MDPFSEAVGLGPHVPPAPTASVDGQNNGDSTGYSAHTNARVVTGWLAVPSILDRIGELGQEANAILGKHEDAPARVVTLEKSYADLGALSPDQDELFRESLRAVEVGLYRAAHVLAWAGFVDFLHDLLIPGHLAVLQAEYPKWGLSSVDDLREHAEFQVIEAGKAVGAYNKTTMKALHGLLSRRNECAHPSGYLPDLNEALGFIGELFKRIAKLQP